MMITDMNGAGHHYDVTVFAKILMDNLGCCAQICGGRLSVFYTQKLKSYLQQPEKRFPKTA